MNVVAHIGNGDKKPEALAGLFDRYGIVKVSRGLAVDGDVRNLSQGFPVMIKTNPGRKEFALCQCRRGKLAGKVMPPRFLGVGLDEIVSGISSKPSCPSGNVTSQSRYEGLEAGHCR